MFPIKNIRQYVTDKLDEITVLKKFRDNNRTLIVTETEPIKKSHDDKAWLQKIEVTSIPINNVWIFENEFDKQQFNISLIEDQKGAFTSAGKKVEKTIIYHRSNKLYLFMIEMKRTISPEKIQKDVVKKFEGSLSTLSVFISAHCEFPILEDVEIYPVGICCYNYYDDKDPTYNNDPRWSASCVREKYSKGERLIPLLIEPIGLNRLKSPIFFFENPNRSPVTESFTINLDDIIEKL